MVRVSGEQAGTGEGGQCEPGMYHLCVDECTVHVSGKGKESLLVTAEVLAGTTPGQRGKKIKFNYFGGQRLFDFAAALNLIDTLTGTPMTAARLRAMREDATAGRPVADCDFDPQDAIGRQFCCDVVLEKNQQGKEYPKLGFKLLNVFDDRAADVPKDQEILALLSGNAPQAVAQPGNDAPQQQHVAGGPAAASAAGSKFSSLR